MRTFDFYEFTGILAPGAIVALAILLVFPSLNAAVFVKDLSLGGLGLFVVLAYAAGHLVQAVGNLVEAFWWKAWQGMPTDWLRTQKHKLISPTQREALERQLGEKLSLSTAMDLDKLTSRDWYALTRQVYALVSAQGRAARIDTFNGNYGLNRGVARDAADNPCLVG